MALYERVVHFAQFVLLCAGEVELRRQTDVVRRDFCENLGICDGFDALNFGYGYFLLVVWGNGLVLRLDDDYSFLVGVELVELLLAGYELEGFGPVKPFAIAHYRFNYISRVPLSGLYGSSQLWACVEALCVCSWRQAAGFSMIA